MNMGFPFLPFQRILLFSISLEGFGLFSLACLGELPFTRALRLGSTAGAVNLKAVVKPDLAGGFCLPVPKTTVLVCGSFISACSFPFKALTNVKLPQDRGNFTQIPSASYT